MKHLYLALFFLAISSMAVTVYGSANSTYLYWTGEADTDFFNENNWRMTVELPGGPMPYCAPGAPKRDYQICLNVPDLVNDSHPAAGTIDPGVPIPYNLYAEGAEIQVNGIMTFVTDSKGFTLDDVRLFVQAEFTQGVLSLGGASTVRFSTGGALGANAYINLLDARSWVYFLQDNPVELQATFPNFWVDDAVGMLDQNFRTHQYYQQGAVVRKKDAAYLPLTIHAGASLTGASASLGESVIYAGSSIPGGLNDQARSFVLKRGYMATFANNENGTGKSKVYIASEADLTVNALPEALQGNVSFIRVLPWNWATKKGTGGLITGLDAGWFYNWGLGETSKPDFEYAPMAWGAGGASPTSVNQLIQKEKVTHLLGFNESDNCDDQSGQFNNLCQPEVAVAYYENLMRTGMRLGTPAPRENGPTTWLLQFNNIAKQRDVRFDFVAVHWYDWGSNPASSPNADPVQIFNRFQAYLANVYQIYGLPIWITEFNANPNRGNAIQAAFLELALPYLESLDYVERYAYFQPDPQYSSNQVSSAYYYDDNGNLTNIGTIYLNHTSTPSIPEASLECPNNLENMNVAYVETPADIRAFEAECGLYKGNQWEIKEDASASNQHYIQANTTFTAATDLGKQTHFEFESSQNETLQLWVRLSTVSGANGSLRIRMDDGELANITGMNATNFTWFRIPRYYTLTKGKHRLTIQYVNTGTRLDQIALVNSSVAIDLPPDAGNTACTFPAEGWGIVNNPTIYWVEGEASAQAGAEWETAADADAVGGQFIQPVAGVSAINTPPGAAGRVTYEFQVNSKDEFNIWGKVQAYTAASDAFWFSVDGEPFRKWDNLANDAFLWKWNKFHFSEGAVHRPFTYFLQEGLHTITIAYSENGAKLDRLAIASTSLLPSQTDPDVLRPDPVLDFEAENAVFVGTITTANCATSSNGQQVGIGTTGTNRVRFTNVAVPIAGAYRLTISYMSENARTFRLWVNGTLLGTVSVASSGAWCFNGGSPADFYRSIQLNAGVNTIEIGPVAAQNAPFIDKISLEREAISLEAELATLNGTLTINPCSLASNGNVVDMKNVGTNSINFNNVTVSGAGIYTMDVSYISAVARNARISVNGGAFQTYNFASSGNWCSASGTPWIKTIDIPLNQGANTIQFSPVAGTDAPFIDKIALFRCPDYSAQMAGTANICPGGSTELTVQIDGGTPPYAIVYSPDGGATEITLNGYQSGSAIPVMPAAATTYTLISVTDAIGCAASISGSSNTAMVTIGDNTLPSITCPDAQTLALGANCAASLPDYTALATANDNCGVQSVTQSPAPGTIVSGTGTLTVTLTVNDVNNLTNTCTFTVNKVDNTPPSITCPAAQTLVLDDICIATLPDYTGLATTGDNCGVQSVTQSPMPGTPVSGLGDMTVTLTVTDVNSLTNTCTFTVNKVDNTPPSITCPSAQTLVLGSNCSAALPDYTGLAAANDNCGVQSVTQSPAPGTIVSGAGDLTVTLTATDVNSLTNICTFTVNKVDTAPGITCPAAQTLVLRANCAATLPDYTGLAAANDNCGVQSVTQSPMPGTPVSGAGDLTVTLTVTDVSSLTNTCTFTVNKVDNTPPSTTCPAAQTLVLGSNCAATLPDYTGLANTNDNCGVQSVTQSPAPGTIVSGAGDLTVTLTATDVNGLTNTCTFMVSKVDNIPPGITCPVSQKLTLASNCLAALPDYTSLATTNDNCGIQSVAQSPMPGTIVSGLGTTTVTLTVTDVNGLTNTCTFVVTKESNTPLSVTCPATQTLALRLDCTASLPDYTDLAGTGGICGVQSISQSPLPGTTVSGAGNMTVTLTVAYTNNTTSTCTFTVAKMDNTPPTVQCFNQTVVFNGQNSIALEAEDLVNASDNCGIESVILTPSVIQPNQLGTVVPVTVTVRDINNNVSTCYANVTVGGLPAGWSQQPGGVGCSNSCNNFQYNPATGVWTGTSTGAYYASPYTSDATAFAQRSLCGDGSITALVTSITGSAPGWAGVVMRESNDPGAKKAQLMTNLSNFSRREFRTTTNGSAIPQQFPSQNRYWLRIVRTGNQFAMYVSPNGANWQFAGAQNIVMSNCIQMGLVATNYTVNSTVTATFSDVSFTGSTAPIAGSTGQRAESLRRSSTGAKEGSLEQPYSFEVYPNPTSGELNVDLTQYIGRSVRIELYSIEGKLLQFREVEEVQSVLERLDLSELQNGAYLVKVKSNNLPGLTKRIVLVR